MTCIFTACSGGTEAALDDGVETSFEICICILPELEGEDFSLIVSEISSGGGCSFGMLETNFLRGSQNRGQHIYPRTP